MVEGPKRGFAVPARRWLAGDLRGFVDEHLEPGRIARQGLLDPQMVRDYLKRLDAGDRSVRERVWALVAFQMWHRRWMAAT